MGLRFMLELDFSAANLDGYVGAGIDEFPEPSKVGGHLLQLGSFLLSSACHEGCLKVPRKQLVAFFQLPEVPGQNFWVVLCPAALLSAVAAFACWLPARRASAATRSRR